MTDIDALIAGRFARSPIYAIDSYKAANTDPKDLLVAGADAFDATSRTNPSDQAAKDAFAPYLGMGKVTEASYTPTDKVIINTRADPLKPLADDNTRTSMITMPGARVLQRQRDDAQTDRFFGGKIGQKKPVQAPAEQPKVDVEGNEIAEELQ